MIVLLYLDTTSAVVLVFRTTVLVGGKINWWLDLREYRLHFGKNSSDKLW